MKIWGKNKDGFYFEGFAISTEQLINWLRVISFLKNSKSQEISLDKFNKIDGDILKEICNHSDLADYVYDVGDPDYEMVDGKTQIVGIGSHRIGVEVRDEKGINDLYEKLVFEFDRTVLPNITNFLRMDPSFTWRCQAGGHFLDKLDDPDKISNFLLRFKLGGYKKCPKCQEKVKFSITEQGNIQFSTVVI